MSELTDRLNRYYTEGLKRRAEEQREKETDARQVALALYERAVEDRWDSFIENLEEVAKNGNCSLSMGLHVGTIGFGCNVDVANAIPDVWNEFLNKHGLKAYKGEDTIYVTWIN